MKKRTLLLGCAVAIMVAFPLLAQDVDKIESEFEGGKKIIKIHKGEPLDPLNLTVEQNKEFKKLDLKFKKETLSLRNEVEIKRLEQEVELDAEKPNLTKINTLIDDIHKLEAEIEKKQIAINLQKRDLLTPEQKKVWHDMPHGLGKRNIIIKKDIINDPLLQHHIAIPSSERIEEEIEIH